MNEMPLTPEMLHPPGTTLTVIVDGLRAKCVIGPFGTYSERIAFFFEKEHPEFGEEFVTKHFGFIKPGIVGWGFEDRFFQVSVLDEKNPFDKGAARHGFDET